MRILPVCQWSRQCGGSGHPGWTHTLAGLDPLQFNATQAAVVHNLYPHPADFPKMIWNTNYQKLAAATLFTLFFAGRKYAPKCIVNGQHVQDYLQSHYLAAFSELGRRIRENDLHDTVVLGYDTMNEPGQGYVGMQNITKLPDDDLAFKKGLMPTAFEGMRLGMGLPTKVENWVFTWRGPSKDKTVLLDPKGASAWLSADALAEADAVFGWNRAWPAGCIWAHHGVWDGEDAVLQPEYFADGDYSAYWLSFIRDYIAMIRTHHPNAILFVQPPILETPPVMPPDLQSNLCYAPHWYDGLTLVKKKWCSYNIDYINLQRGKYGTGPLRFLRALRVGEKAIRGCFVDQLETVKNEGQHTIGNFPCILGEIGIPYDLEPAKSNALSRLWAWCASFFYSAVTDEAPADLYVPNAPQNRAMDASINAVERNLANYALWNYVPDNLPGWGDLWNGEDLSIWQEKNAGKQMKLDDASSSASTLALSEQDKKGEMLLPPRISASPNARDILSLHRPHPHATVGIPYEIQFQSPTRSEHASYVYRVQTEDKPNTHPTEIYVPSIHFPTPNVEVSGGRWQAQTVNEHYWVLCWWYEDVAAGDVLELRLTGEKV